MMPDRTRNKKIISLFIFLLLLLSTWALIIYLSGENPLYGFQYILEGSLSNKYYVLSTLNKMVPLMLTALAVAIPSWAGIWNIGGEGQLLFGAFGAAFIGISFNFGNSLINIVFALGFSAIMGLIWAAWPAFLKVRLKINEVVTTLMGNYIALYIISYFINYPFRDPSSTLAQTKYIDNSFKIPYLLSGAQFSSTFFISLGLVIIFYFFRNKTLTGYKLNMVGSNEEFASLCGISIAKCKMIAMMFGGASAGIGGGLLVLGINHRFMQNFSPGFGFTGLLICLLAFNRPLVIIFIAFLFSILQTGSVNLELFTSIPAEISGVLQATMVLFVAAFRSLTSLRRD
ncbi:MAG: ABC transporter permease [Kosmotoga sp.]|nr:MAG: ABC transporter permease [Kosmotoga sp.]